MMFPIKTDCNMPMAIYLNDFGLPKIPMYDSKLDKNKIDILSSEYLSFKISYNILLKSKENIDIDLLNSRIKKLLNMINKYDMNPGYKSISCLEDLIMALEQSKEFYNSCYNDYVKNGREEKSINDISLPFIHLESFVSQYKKFLNNNSYIDHNGQYIEAVHDYGIIEMDDSQVEYIKRIKNQ